MRRGRIDGTSGLPRRRFGNTEGSMNSLTSILLAFTCTSVTHSAEPVPIKLPQQKILSSQQGRYVFGQISEFRKDQFLLDTFTGRLWQVVLNENERIRLEPVPLIQIIGDEAFIPESEEETKNLRKMTRNRTMEEWRKEAEAEKAAAKAVKEDAPPVKKSE